MTFQRILDPKQLRKLSKAAVEHAKVEAKAINSKIKSKNKNSEFDKLKKGDGLYYKISSPLGGKDRSDMDYRRRLTAFQNADAGHDPYNTPRGDAEQVEDFTDFVDIPPFQMEKQETT
ncbi:unnamed protein product [Ambrosiozyma monospora]|uniref:Unnamed protein product n=1 Tax=Ambrosiozyma monospora TaxID=43982 RepID=A0ACB5TD55_AMBMO|nr:unnamed protein product [Ambrosiozyma monospora]